jgi:adenylate cyclase
MLLGVACALAGSLFFVLPWGAQLEQSVGLRGLFQARGQLPPPRDIVIVAITKDAARALQVPYKTEQWPRSLHARLVDGLSRAGADTVVFDLAFRQAREADDVLLADSMQRAGNVLLLEFLEKSTTGGNASGQAVERFDVHRLVPPVASLAQVALATGPFTLPKVPLQVAQFWTFDVNAGDAPSLPLLAMLANAREAHDLLQGIALADLADDRDNGSTGSHVGISKAGAMIRAAAPLARQLRADASLRGRVLRSLPADTSQTQRVRLDRVLTALSAPDSRFLNFFGPPWTVRTLPYDEALKQLDAGSGLQQADSLWHGATVFVGLSSPVQWEQLDEFVTPFSDAQSGHDLSGIEILATAYANLRDDTVVQPLAPVIALPLLLLFGFVIGFLMRGLRPAWGLLAILALATIYAAALLWSFGRWNLWLPVVSPLAIQLPMALIAATALHYVAAKRDRQRIREIFGYYLPEAVVDRIAADGRSPGADRETVFGVCLYTDAARYTALSEDMEPDALAAFMNDYYDVIFEPVRRRGGIVSDVVGDAMMAIWAAREDDRKTRMEACRAALEIQDAVRRRASTGDDTIPHTRIGVHCGKMALAHVGAQHHFEYRAVGDIVNMASRLQALNKETGTTILMSADMLRDIDAAEARALGSFVLAGRRSATDVVELRGWRDPAAT